MRRVKLGDVEFTVVEMENVNDSATITDNPVESGQDVSDHVKQNPSYINIVGQMMGDDASSNLQKLKRYKENGTILKYIGRNIYNNMAIEDIDRIHGVQNRTGFSFDIKLKQVKIATAKEIEIVVANPKTKVPDKKINTAVKATTNNGLQQPKTSMLIERDEARRRELNKEPSTTHTSSSGRIHGGAGRKFGEIVDKYKGGGEKGGGSMKF